MSADPAAALTVGTRRLATLAEAHDRALSARDSLVAFVRLGRPKFLFQSMLVVGLGVALAVHAGHGFSATGYALVLLFGWCTHLMTHYCNEYFDLEADRANASPTSWTGGSRILVDGLLRPVVSLGAAFVLLFVAVFLIAAMPSPTARLLAAAVVAVAWFYTAPPLRLNYHALGEFACALVLYGAGPLLAYHLQAGRLPTEELVYVGVVFAFQYLRMSIMNLSDIDGDRRTGKRTLAVALGAPGLVRLYVVGQVAVYAGIATLTLSGGVPLVAGLALLGVAPVPFWVARQLRAGALTDPARANAVTFWSSMQMPLTAVAITVSLLADVVRTDRALPRPAVTVCAAAIGVFALWFARAVVVNRPNARPRG